MPDSPPAAGPRVPRVIAVMNQKGGVGKTTTTVHLAAALAARGLPTLLIDLDPQAHATLHLGAEPEPGRTVYTAMTALAPGEAPAVREARPNLWLLPSETDLAAAEAELSEAPDRHTRLAAALAPILPRFEFVFIDCPPSLGLLTLNALVAATEVLAPMQAHFLALQGLGKLLETVRLVADDLNRGLRVAGVVLCMHEETTRLSKEVVADLESFFAAARDPGAPETPWRHAVVFRPAVRRNVKLAECPSFGQTIFEYAPAATSASDYRALGDALAAASAGPRRDDPPPVTVVLRQESPALAAERRSV